MVQICFSSANIFAIDSTNTKVSSITDLVQIFLIRVVVQPPWLRNFTFRKFAWAVGCRNNFSDHIGRVTQYDEIHIIILKDIFDIFFSQFKVGQIDWKIFFFWNFCLDSYHINLLHSISWNFWIVIFLRLRLYWRVSILSWRKKLEKFHFFKATSHWRRRVVQDFPYFIIFLIYVFKMNDIVIRKMTGTTVIVDWPPMTILTVHEI